MKTIRNIIVIILIIIGGMCLANAQDVRTTISFKTDPVATVKDGFNLGTSLDYQRSVMYNKLNLFYFPSLNGLDYLEVSATLLGFNAHLGYFNTQRVYGGFKTGGVLREGTSVPHPMMGFEGGYEYYITDGFFIGIGLSAEYRTDSKVWEAKAEPFWRNNGYVKIGVTL